MRTSKRRTDLGWGLAHDVYIFRSPASANNTVVIMTVSPFSTATTPAAFDPTLYYDLKIATAVTCGLAGAWD